MACQDKSHERKTILYIVKEGSCSALAGSKKGRNLTQLENDGILGWHAVVAAVDQAAVQLASRAHAMHLQSIIHAPRNMSKSTEACMHCHVISACYIHRGVGHYLCIHFI